jgi:hypothetical protein
MTAVTLTDPAVRAEIRALRERTTPGLVEFDEDAVRHALIHAAGRELSLVADSASRSLTDQAEAIRHSTADFDDYPRIASVLECVRKSIFRHRGGQEF